MCVRQTCVSMKSLLAESDGGRDHTEDSGSQIILLELGREGLAGTGSIRASGIRFLLYMEMSECI